MTGYMHKDLLTTECVGMRLPVTKPVLLAHLNMGIPDLMPGDGIMIEVLNWEEARQTNKGGLFVQGEPHDWSVVLPGGDTSKVFGRIMLHLPSGSIPIEKPELCHMGPVAEGVRQAH